MITPEAVDDAYDQLSYHAKMDMEHREVERVLEAALPHILAPVLALMENPEHFETQGPHEGYVSVENLRKAMGMQ